MSENQSIPQLIARIRAYTESNNELRVRAHHFVFDKRYTDNPRVQYIVMGINPGEPKKGSGIRGHIPLEETSEFDFLKNDKPTPSATRWRNSCSYICGTLDVALTEALFWSSLDVSELERRYGRLRQSPHLKFCSIQNRALIDIHKPKAVIFVGLRLVDDIAQLYDLLPAGDAIPSPKKGRLIVPFKSTAGLPWIFMKHWSARLSISEKDCMRDYMLKFDNKLRTSDVHKTL